MDAETMTNGEVQPIQAETSTAPETAADPTPEKITVLQKFLNGLFGDRKTEGETDGSKGAGEEAERKETGEDEKPDSGEKTFTKKDLDEAIEAEKRKWQEEQKEAERLKKLSPEERAREEQEKNRAELEGLKKQLLQRDLKEKAVAELDKEGFPVRLAGILTYESQESLEESLKNVKETFQDCLKEAINIRLKGRTPEGLGGAASAENMIRDQIAKNIRGGMI